MKVKVLGSGTSRGVPVIGSTHPVSQSTNPKDKRTRSSVYIQHQKKKILIDCGPDFRQQMLTHGLDDVDEILITHEHLDHVNGIDDVRPINSKWKKEINIYAEKRVCGELEKRFAYAFGPHPYPGLPKINLIEIPVDQDFFLGEIKVTPIRGIHGRLPILGFRIANFTYMTDMSFIEPEVIEQKIKGTQVMIVNALRREPHPTHFSLGQALELADEIKPKQTYFTHISEELGFHEEVEKELPQGVNLAYDGLDFSVEC